MISLLFKILADAAPWRKVVTQDLPKDAKKAGSEAGKEFGAQMKSVVMSYIGAGAVLGALTAQATKAAEVMRDAGQAGLGVEAFQELQAAADATGMSIEEIQKIARELPEDFDRMMKPIREGGGRIMPKADIEALAEISKSLEEGKSFAGRLFSGAWTRFVKQPLGGVDAGIGFAATKAGNLLGSDRLKQLGGFYTKRADAIAASFFPTASDVAPVDSPALAFRKAAADRAQFNEWWESIGGPEASRSGGIETLTHEIRGLRSDIKERL